MEANQALGDGLFDGCEVVNARTSPSIYFT
jgi:hypothetical protein